MISNSKILKWGTGRGSVDWKDLWLRALDYVHIYDSGVNLNAVSYSDLQPQGHLSYLMKCPE